MKRWMQKTALLALGFLLWGIRAEASSQDVILQTEANKVQVTMGALGEEAVSMQMSLEIRVTKGDADTRVSFEFDPGLPGSVKQYRYDQNTGVLSVYVSGDPGHKLSQEEYPLGKVVLEAGDRSAAATVEVRADSLRVVNDAYDLQKIGQVNASPAQNVTAGEDPAEVPPSESGEERDPSGSSGGGSGTTSPAGGSTSLPGESQAPVSADRTKNRKDVGIRANTGSKLPGDDPSEPAPMTPEGETREPDLGEDDPGMGKEPAEGSAEERADQKTERSGRGDWILPAGLAAAGIAAGIVIFLMVQEYERKKRARARKRKRAKKRRGGEPAGRASGSKKKKSSRNQP